MKQVKASVCMLLKNYWPGPQGGAETQARMLVKELHRQGEEVIVLTRWHGLGYKFRESDEGVVIYRLGLGALPYQAAMFLRRLLKKHLRKHNSNGGGNQKSKKERDAATGAAGSGFFPRAFDALMWIHAASFMIESLIFLRIKKSKIRCIHAHETNANGAVSAWLGRMTGLPVLIREVCLPVLWPARPQILPFARYLDRRQRECFFSAQNEDQRTSLIEKGVSSDKIFVVPDGVHMPLEISRVYDNGSALIVANVTQGKVHKAFDILFDAWRKVVNQHPDARLVLVGGRGDNSYWVEYAKQLGIQDQVEFHGWIEDLTPFLNDAAMFLLPSRREGVSIALLTAQSYGLPAVVSDIPGNQFVIENGKNGIVVPVENVDALAEGILTLYRNPSLRVEMGRGSRQLVEARFSIQTVAKRMREIYSELTGEKSHA